MKRTRRRLTWAGLVAAALAVGYHYVTAPRPAPAGFARVERVVDGDTLQVAYAGRTERVRLIGIDTPESRDNAKARRDSRRQHRRLDAVTALGHQAAEFVAALVHPGDLLKLEFDLEARDRYGRMLGYVYLNDGRMLNEVIIRSGYASPMTIPPNVRHQERFLAAFRAARDEGAGLWRDAADALVPAFPGAKPPPQRSRR